MGTGCISMTDGKHARFIANSKILRKAVFRKLYASKMRRHVSSILFDLGKHVLFKFYTVKYNIMFFPVSSQVIEFSLVYYQSKNTLMHPYFKQ